MKTVRKLVGSGYVLITVLIGCIMYIWHKEWEDLEILEMENCKINEFRQKSHETYMQFMEFSFLGETLLEWEKEDVPAYHNKRLEVDSMLCCLKDTYPAEYIDSVRHLLEKKERHILQIVQILDEQQSISKKIASQVPVIVQKSVQEQPKKPKRKGFLGIFGKKEEV